VNSVLASNRAWLDAALESMIAKFMVDDPEVVDRLLGRTRPLSSLSSRIDLAYCVGLIGPAARTDLNTIRDIRNDFAHLIDGLSFDDQSVVGRCNNLTAGKFDFPPPAPVFSAREQFVFAVTILMNQLLVSAMSLQHTNGANDLYVLLYVVAGQSPT
jgi:DNA-binding MltR family transcriptional regulator